MNGLSVLVRFHDLSRLFELRRCLFSLVCQGYRELEICLLTQRFKQDELKHLQQRIKPLLSINPTAQFQLLNYTEAEPADARSALLNLGISHARGRYLAFLDHDDTILHDGYAQLTGELGRTSAAIAFASVAYKDAEIFEETVLVNKRLEAFVGAGLPDLFDHNFCPIHSFVIDRSKVEAPDLYFDSQLTRHEDYEFLLRLCARYPASFRLVGTFIGDYYLKNDGSNSNVWLSEATPESAGSWQESLAFMERRKAEISIAPGIQESLGWNPVENELTIAGFLRQTSNANHGIGQRVMMSDDDHP